MFKYISYVYKDVKELKKEIEEEFRRSETSNPFIEKSFDGFNKKAT